MHDFFKHGKASTIVGGQFGSEAKGLVAAAFAAHYVQAWGVGSDLICTTNAGAQAGHTTILANGAKFVCYHLPTIGAMVPNSQIYINAGAIIDPDVLDNEVIAVAMALGFESPDSLRGRITIHPNAAVINHHHRENEARSTQRISSTMKGVGAALTDKIMRQPGATAASSGKLRNYSIRERALMREMTGPRPKMVVVEIPQGTGLSLNASGFWPYTTSRDCWVGQGLTDAAIHPSFLHQTAMVVRTYPIRVGSLPGTTSGRFFLDSDELDWATHFPELEPERTTVTQRVRRIATWSDRQYQMALELNRPDLVFLTFTNYCSVAQLGDIRIRMANSQRVVGVHPKETFMSWGPRVDQIGREVPMDSFRSETIPNG